jgi:ABC-type multidrug transport system ATPase subunit
MNEGTDARAAVEVVEASVRIDDVMLLAPVSTAIYPRQALVVRGRNGSGKSTLLRLLAGSLNPTTGRVSIGGLPPRKRDRTFRRRVATMIGMPPMAPDLTVRDHARLVASTWFDDADAATAIADRTLDEVGLTGLGLRFPHELSSGQSQLAGLALVLCRPFDVLLLDEPEQRLDPGRLEAVATTLRKRRARGACIVVATHSPTLEAQLADSVITLGEAR